MPRLRQYRQVGNAVPPRLAAAITRHLGTWMGWNLDPTGVGHAAAPAWGADAAAAAAERDRMRRDYRPAAPSRFLVWQ